MHKQVHLLNKLVKFYKIEKMFYLKIYSTTIEEIVDSYYVDVMYGKYIEAIFDPPLIIVFTNERISNYLNYLSKDRWVKISN